MNLSPRPKCRGIKKKNRTTFPAHTLADRCFYFTVFLLMHFFSPTHAQSSDSAAVTQLFLFLREAAARRRKHRSDVAFRDLLHPPADASQRKQKQHPLKSGSYNLYVSRLGYAERLTICRAVALTRLLPITSRRKLIGHGIQRTD